MTQETIRTLSEKDLSQVITWAQDELKVRADQRKHDTIAKIRELAGAVGVSVTINGRRGRPPKLKADTASAKGVKLKTAS
jgi:hypothetical protein